MARQTHTHTLTQNHRTLFIGNGTDQLAQKKLAPLKQPTLGDRCGIVATLLEAIAQKPAKVWNRLHKVPYAGRVGRRRRHCLHRRRQVQGGRLCAALEGAGDATPHLGLGHSVLKLVLHERAKKGIKCLVEDSVRPAARHVELATYQVAFFFFYHYLGLVNERCFAISG
jgi:hypothetical protein